MKTAISFISLCFFENQLEHLICVPMSKTQCIVLPFTSQAHLVFILLTFLAH